MILDSLSASQREVHLDNLLTATGHSLAITEQLRRTFSSGPSNADCTRQMQSSWDARLPVRLPVGMLAHFLSSCPLLRCWLLACAMPFSLDAIFLLAQLLPREVHYYGRNIGDDEVQALVKAPRSCACLQIGSVPSAIQWK